MVVKDLELQQISGKGAGFIELFPEFALCVGEPALVLIYQVGCGSGHGLEIDVLELGRAQQLLDVACVFLHADDEARVLVICDGYLLNCRTEFLYLFGGLVKMRSG